MNVLWGALFCLLPHPPAFFLLASQSGLRASPLPRLSTLTGCWRPPAISSFWVFLVLPSGCHLLLSPHSLEQARPSRGIPFCCLPPHVCVHVLPSWLTWAKSQLSVPSWGLEHCGGLQVLSRGHMSHFSLGRGPSGGFPQSPQTAPLTPTPERLCPQGMVSLTVSWLDLAV